jgi:hypothetical protein
MSRVLSIHWVVESFYSRKTSSCDAKEPENGGFSRDCEEAPVITLQLPSVQLFDGSERVMIVSITGS